MAKKLSLVDFIKAQPMPKTGPKGWFELMPEGSQKDDFRELHRAFHAGEFKGLSKRSILNAINKRYGLAIKINAFSQWIEGTLDGQAH